MANLYRTNYVDKVLTDVDNNTYVEGHRLQTAIKYVKEAQATLERNEKRLVNKELKQLEKLNKEVDVQLASA